MADEPFLARWSRRKQQTAKAEPEPPPVEAAVQPVEPPDEETRQQWIDELSKIDIDALSYADDFKIFMQAWVPETLRRKALRKLWGSDPLLACLDGLNDYEEDFTDAGSVVANLKTAWRPGSGFGWMDTPKPEEEIAEEVAAEDETLDTDPLVSEVSDALVPEEPEPSGEPPLALEHPVPAGQPETPLTPRPRRMVWRRDGEDNEA